LFSSFWGAQEHRTYLKNETPSYAINRLVCMVAKAEVKITTNGGIYYDNGEINYD